jgi:nucleotide-binding universal stress UspA family protein
MFRRLLVAVDGSTQSARAVSEAVDLARAGKGGLTLISVGSPPRIWPSVSHAVLNQSPAAVLIVHEETR